MCCNDAGCWAIMSCSSPMDLSQTTAFGEIMLIDLAISFIFSKRPGTSVAAFWVWILSMLSSSALIGQKWRTSVGTLSRLCDPSSLILWKANYPVVCFAIIFFFKILHFFSKNWPLGPQNSNSWGQNLSGDKFWSKSDQILMEIKLQTSLKLHKGSLIELKTMPTNQTTGSHRLVPWAILGVPRGWPGVPLGYPLGTPRVPPGYLGVPLRYHRGITGVAPG